jgi:hypothetical protein
MPSWWPLKAALKEFAQYGMGSKCIALPALLQVT